MTKKENLQNLQKITKKIIKEYQPEKIILFGSYAWGKPNKDSDFDLFIIKKRKTNYLKEQQRIRKIINGEIAADILIYTPKELDKRIKLKDFFFEDILKKGKYLYEK